MISTFSHDAGMPGQQDVVAGVYSFGSVRCKNLFALPVDASRAPLVKAIQHVIYVAQVGYSVVGSIVVDVVNNVRLFAMNKIPSKPMGKVGNAAAPNDNVPKPPLCAGNGAYLGSVIVSNPSEQPRIGIVIKDIADRVWNNLWSHVESPLSVVRGLVTAITSAPILARGACS